MTKQDKQRLTLIATVIIAAVILWLLLRGKTSAGNTVIRNSGGATYAGGGVDPFGLAGIAPLNYTPGDFSYTGATINAPGGKGCTLCYSGYQRVQTASPAPSYPAMSPQQINNFILNYRTVDAPRTGFTAYVDPTPAKPSWNGYMGELSW